MGTHVSSQASGTDQVSESPRRLSKSSNKSSNSPPRTTNRIVYTHAMVANSAASVRAVLLGMTSSTTSCSTSRVAAMVRPERTSSSSAHAIAHCPAMDNASASWSRNTALRSAKYNAHAAPHNTRPTTRIALVDSSLNVMPMNASRRIPASHPANPSINAMNQGRCEVSAGGAGASAAITPRARSASTRSFIPRPLRASDARCPRECARPLSSSRSATAPTTATPLRP